MNMRSPIHNLNRFKSFTDMRYMLTKVNGQNGKVIIQVKNKLQFRHVLTGEL